jgi:TPR repeat protein
MVKHLSIVPDGDMNMNSVDPTLKAAIKAFEEQSYQEAYRLLIPLAEAGNPQAQCYIASMYQGGFGVPVDGAKAVEWYLKAAVQQDRTERISAVAYNNLGTIYSAGMPGVASDAQLAKEYWRKAVELGFEMIPKEWYAS